MAHAPVASRRGRTTPDPNPVGAPFAGSTMSAVADFDEGSMARGRQRAPRNAKVNA